ncbi:MAG: hypothetical protein ACR2LU_13280, partial [Luteitalea sp.]
LASAGSSVAPTAAAAAAPFAADAALSRVAAAGAVVDEGPSPPPLTDPAAPAAARASAPEAFVDPSVVYEDEVKGALVDAVLDYAGSLPMTPTEWVTVAARDAGYIAFPDTVSDMVTVTLSVRVSDLADFRARRLTRDEARARVVIREF